MKKIETLIFCMLIMLCAFDLKAQNDSTYSYVYDCLDCGTFKTISTEPIEVVTSVSISSAVLPDVSTNTIAAFSSVTARKASPSKSNVINQHKNIFNVYPNPVKKNYFLYFDNAVNGKANVQVIDLYGRILINTELELKQGTNVIERTVANLSNGSYFIKVGFDDNVFTEKILVEK